MVSWLNEGGREGGRESRPPRSPSRPVKHRALRRSWRPATARQAREAAAGPRSRVQNLTSKMPAGHKRQKLNGDLFQMCSLMRTPAPGLQPPSVRRARAEGSWPPETETHRVPPHGRLDRALRWARVLLPPHVLLRVTVFPLQAPPPHLCGRGEGSWQRSGEKPGAETRASSDPRPPRSAGQAPRTRGGTVTFRKFRALVASTHGLQAHSADTDRLARLQRLPGG